MVVRSQAFSTEGKIVEFMRRMDGLRKQEIKIDQELLPAAEEEAQRAHINLKDLREQVKKARELYKEKQAKLSRLRDEWNMVFTKRQSIEREVFLLKKNRGRGGYAEAAMKQKYTGGFTPRGDDDFAEAVNDVC